MSCLFGHCRKAMCFSVALLKCLLAEISLISEHFSPERAIVEDEKEGKPSHGRMKVELNKIFQVFYP